MCPEPILIDLTLYEYKSSFCMLEVLYGEVTLTERSWNLSLKLQVRDKCNRLKCFPKTHLSRTTYDMTILNKHRHFHMAIPTNELPKWLYLTSSLFLWISKLEKNYIFWTIVIAAKSNLEQSLLFRKCNSFPSWIFLTIWPYSTHSRIIKL